MRNDCWASIILVSGYGTLNKKIFVLTDSYLPVCILIEVIQQSHEPSPARTGPYRSWDTSPASASEKGNQQVTCHIHKDRHHITYTRRI